MAWHLRIEFVRSSYDASSVLDNAQHEWPPHPARLFNALVDAAALDSAPGGEHALRSLELLSAPTIVIDRSTTAERAQSERIGYVPTNQHANAEADIWKTGYPARIAKGPRTWPRVNGGPLVVMAFDEDLGTDDAHAVGLLCKLVGYLGRATTPVLVEMVDGRPEVTEHQVELHPNDEFRGHEVSLPRPGYLDALQLAFDEGRSAHLVPRRWVSYAEAPKADNAHPSPFDVPVVLPFERRLDPRSVRLLTGRLRAALERQLDPAPALLNGHPQSGETAPRHQIALVGLPSSFGDHADGLLRGIGVVFPRTVDAETRQRVVDALAHVPELHLGRGGVAKFGAVHGSQLVTLRPRAWSRPSTTWTTVTPLVSDRYLRQNDEQGWTEQIRRSCAHGDLPDPIEIEYSTVPWAPGALRAPDYDTRRPLPKDTAKAAQRRGERAKPGMHVRLRFPLPVRGPVILGNLRYYGLGLCVPVAPVETDDDHE